LRKAATPRVAVFFVAATDNPAPAQVDIAGIGVEHEAGLARPCTPETGHRRGPNPLWKVLRRARKRALAHGVEVSSQVRVAHDAGRAILEAARELRCSLIVLGWRGTTSTARRILGEVTDHVVNHAATDVMAVKLGPDERPDALK